MELEQIIEAIKEALAERLDPIEERLTALEAGAKTLEADQAALNKSVKGFSESIDGVVGKSQQVAPGEAVAEKANTDSPRRDAWGRRLHSA